MLDIAYRDIDRTFGFLFRLTSLSNNKIYQAASLLMSEYPDFEDNLLSILFTL